MRAPGQTIVVRECIPCIPSDITSVIRGSARIAKDAYLHYVGHEYQRLKRRTRDLGALNELLREYCDSP